MIENKSCPKCGIIKPSSEFYRNKRQKDGLSVWCKVDTSADTKARRLANPEKYKELHRRNYENNKEEKLAYTAQWARDNRDKRREIERRYREANLDKRLHWENERRARKLEKTSNFPSNGRQILFDFYGRGCMNPDCAKEISDINPLTMDHVIPISWPEGTHSLENMQLLCLSCNSSKGNDSDTDYRKGKICVLV